MNKAAPMSRTLAGTHIPIAILAPVDNPVVLLTAGDGLPVLLVDVDVDPDAVLVIKTIGFALSVATTCVCVPMVPSNA